jgi:hypothetical protein
MRTGLQVEYNTFDSTCFRRYWSSSNSLANTIEKLKKKSKRQTPWLSVRKRTILTEVPPFFSDISTTLAGRAIRGVRAMDPRGR